MSERFLKYETEAENGMVDERGLLIPSGGAGGYKYFGVSFYNYDDKVNIFKMDKLDDADIKYGISRSEFEDAYKTQPIMLVPVDIHSGEVLFEKFDSTSYQIRPLIGYIVYSGTPLAFTAKPDGTVTGVESHELKFATE